MEDRFVYLRYAQEYVANNIEKGVICPCCLKYVKRWKVSINSRMAAELIKLYRLGGDWHHVTDFYLLNNGGGNFTKLRYWDLVEEKKKRPEEKPEVRNLGMWRITDLGVKFVRKQVKLPKYVLTQNNLCVGFVGPQASISDALKNKFNYQELMNA